MNTPRTLLIDMTRIGDGTATGELKSNLFARWPAADLMQIYLGPGGKLGVSVNGEDTFVGSAKSNSVSIILRQAQAFEPDVVLLRPTPNTEHLHNVAMQLIDDLDTPLVLWIMDDWPASLDETEHNRVLLHDWNRLLPRANRRLSISNAMATAFKERYGVDFTAVANGVDPRDWPSSVREKSGGVTVRYTGSLARNMSFYSVKLIAQAVEQVAAEGFDIRFEIKTRSNWRKDAEPEFEAFTHTSFNDVALSPDAYRKWLSEADINVIAYNFDDQSKGYIQYSLANKLPECLASGAALLAVGPSDVATLSLLDDLNCGLRVNLDSVDATARALKELASSPQRRSDLAQHAQEAAFRRFNITDMRRMLAETLLAASKEERISESPASEEPRHHGAHVDETAVVAQLLSDRKGRGHVMIDVGAHVGTSAAYFDKLNWTINCFEPDVKNREKLTARFGSARNITIDPRAVGDVPKSGVAFYTSEESTGISGLSAFRDTHVATDRVDITTVGEIVRDRRITSIDFLKIDVEGFDFSVLKGVPWETMRPDVIECEFEDAKTIQLGHNWRDVALYLENKGYAVYISEWHPIIRYGIPHDWRRIIPFQQQTQIPPDAWGNLLAFRIDPGITAVQTAFSALLNRGNETPGSNVTPVQKTKKAAQSRMQDTGHISRPVYADYAERLRKRSPRVFAAARLFRRVLAALWRKRLLALAAIAAFGIVLFMGVTQPDMTGKLVIIGGALFVATLSSILYLGWWTYHRLRALTLATASLTRLGEENRSQRDASEKRIWREIDERFIRVNSMLSNETRKVRQMVEELAVALAVEKKDRDTALTIINENFAELTASTDDALNRIGAQVVATAALDDLIAEIDLGIKGIEADLDAARRGEGEARHEADELRREHKAQADQIGVITRERDTLRRRISDIEVLAKQLADGLLDGSDSGENASSDHAALKAQLTKIAELKSEVAKIPEVKEAAHRADQKRMISENNLRALQQKYKLLAERCEAQTAQLEKAHEHILAARQQLKSLEKKS